MSNSVVFARDNLAARIFGRFADTLRAGAVWMIVALPIWLILLLSHIGESSPADRLLEAAQAGDLHELRASVACGAQVDARDQIGFTPLMVASRAGNLNTAAYLIAQGANIDAKTPICGTALMQAALYGRTEIVRLLVANHADVCAVNECGITALDYAMMSTSASQELIACLRHAGAPRGTSNVFSLSE